MALWLQDSRAESMLGPEADVVDGYKWRTWNTFSKRVLRN